MRSHDLPRIAVVEDDPIMGESLIERLSLEGYDPVLWRTGHEALEGLHLRRPDLMVCDIRLPDIDGEEVFRRALPAIGSCPVLFVTAFGDIDQAVRVVRSGADDYLTKPFDMERFLERVRGLLDRHREIENAAGTMGQSTAMRQVETLLRRVADIESTVALTGESGVGKEVAAQFLHGISSRKNEPFMAVNCAAIPPDLLESELFGHEKGAFTGAHARHCGFAERAGGGILFLDEISEMPSAVQAKLLRLIQERTFFRVGGEKPVNFTARLICSSNADLETLMELGTFRRDLYFRINVIRVHIPALRERRDDIVPLLRHFAAFFAPTLGREVRGLTAAAEAAATNYPWPGNVRELRNRIERAVALANRPWLGIGELFPESNPAEDNGEPGLQPLSEARDVAERRHILAALERANGHIKKAATLLGISRTTLWEKMKRLGIEGMAGS